ncbi:hypothetical protein CcaverHIS002_0310450 [Cutaneotrichosporon cavernicola]|uniref:HIT-type domain-containing protein n=1 Tax=Cutaneotrichosporon cavernicola TaxID=279322 RepID=A0AA48IG11_9TREE|nr:uncharacterized protein CcaverHIS019_0310310 [Cutaneotrichosporon cavernicola]BEI83177.1 hypothetical protein CcaverHIS002_0310450 [Cutaneotrichosporon cavernicola]BEI90961.1 hypothetical protein CcaverHIS019_0310310 [Cutaneotrichosporon cavernicola]BEI98739.1 hypothetical protein CcaverHIS631_0310380 [Cutaneotrichosporon cavernicola]BEJ06511.1 hypothetical protein CcaverHIS641_0310330 [Cutaneotrichosporon cavernicola]
MPLPPPTSLSLPPKPSTARSAASNSSVEKQAFTAATSAPSPKCSICKSPAKYTCPRCAARSCSLPCSKAHKEKKGCSGVRDPAAFVPLAKFTQGTWDGDYAWLESTRRQVAVFGEGNQSSWNHKTKTLAITIQLVPSGRLAADKIVHARVRVLPTAVTLNSLLPESFSDVVFVMPYHIPRRRAAEIRPPGRGAYFPPLPGGKGLDVALHGTAFVEFPVIQVWARDEWERAVRSRAVGVMPSLQPPRVEEEEEEEERPTKMAKVETSALAGLGDYGDSEDEDEDEDEDEEEGEVEGVAEEESGEQGETGETEEGGDITLDPAMAEALGKALEADFGPA